MGEDRTSPSRPGYVEFFSPSGPVVEPCSTQADCNCHPAWRSRRVTGAAGVAAKSCEQARRATTHDATRDMVDPRRAWYMTTLLGGRRRHIRDRCARLLAMARVRSIIRVTRP